MNVLNYSELKKDLKGHLKKVYDDQDVLIVHRPKGKSVVIMTLDEYNSFAETKYLLSSPKNAERLAKSIKSAEEGLTKEVSLEELKNFEKKK
ncbi:type II toxin-antitoxin system Phd/YefM family antitoxin [Mariniphaga sp.]|uniref:type II toxin-antitoxin system Phd/YefM family antitoxin n=1 Tax=Mariniphaga sp. TaxID=1954475 RepID=UPI00356149EF